jgi:hypothetical protein
MYYGGSDETETRSDFMSSQTLPTPLAETPATPASDASPAPAPARQTEPTTIPEKWKPLFRELTTYYRRLPELLAEGEAGRYAVIHGDELCNTWDTVGDALQYGHERFGDQPFMVHQVDPRDVQRLAQFFPAKEAACPS